MNAAVSTLPKVHDFCSHVSEPLWRLVAAACVKGTPAATRAAILEARAQVGDAREKKLWPRGLVETCMDIALWHAVCELAETGHTITVTTLCSSLASSRKGFSPEQIGETAQRLRVLTQTIDEPVTDIEGLVDQIVKVDVRSAQRSAVLAQPLAANPHEVARTIAVLADEVGADQVDDWAEAVDDLFDPNTPPRRVVSTGFPSLDGLLGGGIDDNDPEGAPIGGGLGLGEQTIFAAGSSVGKSLITGALALSILGVRTCHGFKMPGEAIDGQRSFVLLKRPELEALARRVLPVPDHYPVHVLVLATESERMSYLKRAQQDLMHCTLQELNDLSLRADIFTDRHVIRDRFRAVLLHPDRPLTIMGRKELGSKHVHVLQRAIRKWVQTKRQHAAEHGYPQPKLVVMVDYLQRVDVPEAQARRASRQVELQRINGQLYALAQPLDIALCCTAMLNGRIGHVDPGENTIRECADIEQDTDNLLYLDAVPDKSVACMRALGHTEADYADAVNVLKAYGVKGRYIGTMRGQPVYLRCQRTYQRLSEFSAQEFRSLMERYDNDPIAWARQWQWSDDNAKSEPRKRKRKKKGDDEESLA